MRRVAVIFGAAAIVLIFTLNAFSPMVTAESVAEPSNCSLAGETAPAVSNVAATSIAERSSAFLSAVQGKSFYLSGFAASWSCTKLESLDANFIATNGTGYQEDIVAAMNVSANHTPTRVFAIRILPVGDFSCGTNGSNCQQSLTHQSGYAFCSGQNSGGAYCQNPPVNSIPGVYGYFDDPNVYPPSGSNQPGCVNPVCEFASWVGLQTCIGSGCQTAELLQAGAYSNVGCFGICTEAYSVFWENYPANKPQYCSWSPSPGNHILPQVSADYGNYYYVEVQDSSTGQACTSAPFPYSWSYTPYWGIFSIEFRYGYDFAKFSNYWFQGGIGSGGTTTPISRYFGDGWYEALTPMVNSGVINICSGTWSPPSCSPDVQSGSTGYGEFYNTWNSSQNT